MLSDTEMDDLRWKSELIGGVVPVRPEELRQLLDEIARLRAELDRSQSEHRHTMHVMDGMHEEITKLHAMVESAEANAKLHFDALNGCGVQISAIVGRRYKTIDISEVADEAQNAIRELTDQLTDAAEQIERLEAEAEKRGWVHP